MRDDLTHPAGEVVGGLWFDPPAPIRVRGRDAFAVKLWGGHVDYCVLSPPYSGARWESVDSAPLSVVALRLDDPRGLGLAGLAAGVAERIGKRSVSAPDVAVALNGCSWFTSWHGKRPANRLPPSYRDAHGNVVPWYVLDVRHASSYLALTDRLCDLVGLKLAEGEVARWEPAALPGSWCLSHTRVPGRVAALGFGPGAIYAERRVPALEGITDPLTALRAAVAALETP